MKDDHRPNQVKRRADELEIRIVDVGALRLSLQLCGSGRAAQAEKIKGVKDTTSIEHFVWTDTRDTHTVRRSAMSVLPMISRQRVNSGCANLAKPCLTALAIAARHCRRMGESIVS